jgi:hypothetical protein
VNQKFGRIILLVAIILFCFIGRTSQAQKKVERVWEYKVVSALSLNEKSLNELGAQGWELVLLQPNIQNGTASGGTSISNAPSKND